MTSRVCAWGDECQATTESRILLAGELESSDKEVKSRAIHERGTAAVSPACLAQS